MLSGHINLLRALTQVTQFFRSTELTWNTLKVKLEHCRNDKAEQRKYVFQVSVFTLATILLIFQGISLNSSSDHISNATSRTLYYFEAFMYIIKCMYFISTRVHLHSTCNYVNGILQFPEIYNMTGLNSKKINSLSFMDKLNLGFAYLSSPFCYPVPVLYFFGLHWHSPCKPSVVEYGLLMECWKYEYEEWF